MSGKTVVITGSSRGIGRQLAVAYAGLGWRVVATARQLAALDGIPAAEKYALDVADPASVASFAARLGANTKVHLLINNAGVLSNPKRVEDVTKEQLVDAFQTNSVGPFLVTQALLPNLKLAAAENNSAAGVGAVVVNVSSIQGSIAENSSGGYYSYRASKSASNSLSKSLAIDLKPFNISVLQLHPGYVKTDMSPAGIVSTVDSVDGMSKVIARAFDNALTGIFYDFQGKELPW
ncbi:hypothetical protein HK100_004614 [Physocladia obscura]|uniref:Uncharacterized protein n=1 Tax=Physocladia obscura TaxID=109957 RepID=A0AAD5X8N0_9FUNG|nr:hypothetical protein HK100_004614 [Physocladia obscura]